MKNELEQKIDEILSRGVGEFIDPDNVFRKKLIAKDEGKYNKEIIIKYGVDPTRPDIHLGHAVCFRKLRQLQDLGCKIVFLIGDYTATIGDPTGKDKKRPDLEFKIVKENMKTYIEQIEKTTLITDNKKLFAWVPNSFWFLSIHDFLDNQAAIPSIDEKVKYWKDQVEEIKNRLEVSKVMTVTMHTLLWTLKHITHARIMDRDMFQERIKQGKHLFINEMMYPVFQSIDSFVINSLFGSCDLELGGTDQKFNMLLGRDVMQNSNQNPQAVVTLKILEGTDGKDKMSKSLDNYIGITEEPNQMFGKVMSIPDSSIINYFELCTDVPMEEIREKERKMNLGKSFLDKMLISLRIKKQELNPRDAKVELAYEIVKIYHGEDNAQKAKQYFINTFSKKEIPENIQAVPSPAPEISIVDYMIEAKLADSKSDARRKIEQGGVSVNGEKINSVDFMLNSESDYGKVIKVGKRNFVKFE